MTGLLNPEGGISQFANVLDSSIDVTALLQPPKKEKAKRPTRDDKKEKWSGIAERQLTPEMKADLELIRNRNAIDPKKHYKSTGWGKKLPTAVQSGTVIEPASSYYSGRIAKKHRKGTMMGEYLAAGADSYVEKKVRSLVKEGQDRRVPKSRGRGRGRGRVLTGGRRGR